MNSRSSLLVAALMSLAAHTGKSQPVITAQPQWQTNAVGSTAMFLVVASGVPPLFYLIAFWKYSAATGKLVPLKTWK